jgi:hypothetical protein
MTPTYSMGLPLLLAAAAGIVGWGSAPGMVIGLHALFGLLLMYRLGREFGLEADWAWIGSLLLGANSLYLLMSFGLMSDMPATVWLTAAVLCAWKGRARPQFALAAGIAFSIAVLVRPNDLLGVIPVCLALGLPGMISTRGPAAVGVEQTVTSREAPREASGPGLRRWLLLIAGGLPGAVFYCYVNHTLYGGIFKTGYGDLRWMFSVSYVPASLLHYAHWLPVLLTPVVVLSLGLPLLWRRQPIQTAVLATWALLLPAFYAFYSDTDLTWWCLRFLLPAFPPLLVASLLVARNLTARFKLNNPAGWLAFAVVLILVNDGVCFYNLHLASIGRDERLYRETAAWMQEHLPADALVASMQTSGALFYYTRFTFFRWDQVSAADFRRIADACAAARRPIYAALFPFEFEENRPLSFRKHLGSGWTRIAAFRHITIWKYNFPAEPALALPAPEK